MVKFNNNDIFTGYIKQLLQDSYLPNCSVIKDGDKAIVGSYYIYGNKIIRITGTSTASSNVVAMGSDATYKVIDQFITGKNYSGITKKFVINSLIYDSYTHNYLGDYLRFYRDYKGINLMTMYNCFSNEMPRNLSYDLKKTEGGTTTTITTFDSDDKNYKIYMVPIKFFKKYTIGIECLSKIEMICGTYRNSDLLNMFDATYKVMHGARLHKPFCYDKLFNLNTIIDCEQINDLKLFIKIPFNCETSIAVIEGDYSRCFDRVVGNTPTINIGGVGVSRLQLFSINTGNSYPFADRLIEYLSNNAIRPYDEVNANIKYVQSKLVDNNQNINVSKINPNTKGWYESSGSVTSDTTVMLGKKYYADSSHTTVIDVFNTYNLNSLIPSPEYVVAHPYEWGDNMSSTIYNYAQCSGLINKKYDIIGYYDKDIEEKLGR